jgi:hypothetical protein
LCSRREPSPVKERKPYIRAANTVVASKVGTERWDMKSEPAKKVTYEPTIRLGYLNNAKYFRTETQDSINEEAIRWATDR